MLKLSIKAKISLSLITVFTIMLLVSVYIFVQLQVISKQTLQLYKHPYQISNTVREIKNKIYTTENLLWDFQHAGNLHQLDSLKAETDSADAFIQEGFNIVSLSYSGDKATVDSAYSAYISWRMAQNKFYKLRKENGSESIQAELKSEDRIKFDKINSFLALISNTSKDKAENTFKEIMITENNSKIISIILLLFSALLITFLIWYLSRSIERPIKAFLREANLLLKKEEKTEFVADEQIMILTLKELKNAYVSIEKQDYDISLKNKQLSEMNLELEEKIRQRTVELVNANNELERNILKRTHELNDALELNFKIFETSPLGIIAFREDGP